MDKLSKIYLAGHKGLVGSAIHRKLKELEYANIIVRTHEELDLTRQEQVESFFAREKPEYVFLAAAKVGGILANATYPAEFIYDNLAIEVNTIHAAYRYRVKKLLFLGSSCIYPRECPQPMKEDYLLTGPLEPTNEAYAIAKIAGIKMCQAYNTQYGTKFISVMPTNLYGPNDNFDLETSHVLPALVRKFHLAKLAAEEKWDLIEIDERVFGKIPADIKEVLPKVKLWGNGKPRREFLHVDDLADACVFLMNNYDGSEIVNIGVGSDLSIAELAEMVAEVVGFKGEIIFDTSKPDGTPQKLLDVTRLKNFRWSPQIDLVRGIEQTYNWYLEQAFRIK